MVNEIQTQILAELRQIRRFLAILTKKERQEHQQWVKETFLTTEARAKMFDLIDGTHNMGEICQMAGVSDETVRLFIKQLVDAGEIEIEQVGRERIPRRVHL